MSVLCCHIPDFLMQLTLRRHPEWTEKPLALLGPDERVWAVSEPAYADGVRRQMLPRQAQMRCPDLLLMPADLQAGQDEQAALLGILARWELPVEPLDWGLAYMDLAPVARGAAQVQSLAGELGQSIRTQLGDPLQPSLGWDSGKFTARAAALRTRPGHIRLVDKTQEVRFLTPLPITLLPLERAALQQLQWLGIRTLGQFGCLPEVAVWQRFGQAGKLAQRWARGQDDRPVWNGVPPGPPALTIDIDPPTALLPPVVEALLDALLSPLQISIDRLQGWRRLRLRLRFVDGEERTLDLVFVEAVRREERLRRALTARLAALNWPAELSYVQVDVVEVSELPAQQLSLFEETSGAGPNPARTAAKLCTKYGSVFFQAALLEAGHPVAERRTRLHSIP